MSDLKFYKNVFLLAGLWNTGAGIIAILFYKFILEKVFLHPAGGNDTLMIVYHMILFFTVMVIGLALLLASRDPANNRALIFACALGKIVPPVIWGWLYFSGGASWMLISGILVDTLFGVFFIIYLIKRPVR